MCREIAKKRPTSPFIPHNRDTRNNCATVPLCAWPTILSHGRNESILDVTTFKM
jgi:hypothetical protein